MYEEEVLQTTYRNAAGANIKGTPAMSARQVAHDLRLLRNRVSVLVTQELKWPWYWRTLARVLPNRGKKRWNSSPRKNKGLADPILGAQAVIWQANLWEHITTRKRILMRKGPFSETRYLRAVLLEDRDTGLRAWFGTTHFVVGGDRIDDSAARRLALKRNIKKLDRFLTLLERTGEPIYFELDANIHQKSDAYDRFMKMLRSHNTKIRGWHGVEYQFTIDGEDTEFDVSNVWRIDPEVLNTDHEVRGIRFRLREK